jgi:hypothetical protein
VALLLVTSRGGVWLPGRPVEITDALIALLVALVFALLPDDGDRARPAQKRRGPDDWQPSRLFGVKTER